MEIANDSSFIKKFKRTVILTFVALILSGGILFISDHFPRLIPYDSFISDYFRVLRANSVASHQEVKRSVVLVGVSEKFLNQLPYRSPLDRCVLSLVLESILSLNPKVIGVDYLFDVETEPEKDSQLRSIFRRYRDRIVVAKSPINYVQKGLPKGDATVASFGLEGMLASAVIIKDHDGVVRRASLTDANTPTFALRLAEHLGEVDSKIKTGDIFQIDWLSKKSGQGDVFPTLPIDAFTDKSMNEKCGVNIQPSEINIDDIRHLVENKIVILGADLDREDRHLSPFDILTEGQPVLSGAEIHAQIVQQVLDRRTIRNVNFIWAVLLVSAAFLFSHLVEKSKKLSEFKDGKMSLFVKFMLLILATLVVYVVAYSIEFVFIFVWGYVSPTGPIMMALGAPFVPYFKQLILK